LEDISNPLSWAAKGWSRAASASILPAILDMGLAATPTDFRFDARASGQATSGLSGNPFFGHYDKASQAVKGWGKAVFNLQAPTQSTVKDTASAFLPFSNWIGFTAVLNSLISPLPTQYGGKKKKLTNITGYQY